MSIVSHTHQFILLTTSKTASSSVEASLARYLGRKDWVRLTSDLGAIDHPFLRTAGRTTTWLPWEKDIKRWLSRTGMFPALLLQKHASAAQVRSLVAPDVWERYTKIVVERDPWDRFLSLWRWKTRKQPRSIDEFLGEVEALAADAPNHPQRRQWWTTWPIYTIDDRIVVDIIVRYERLEDELHSALSRVGIGWDRWLPRFKSRYRQPHDRSEGLTAQQIERIAALCAKEIAANGYAPPVSSRSGP